MKQISHGLHCAIGRYRSPEAQARRKERERAQRLKDKEAIAALRAAGTLAAAFSREPPDHVIEEARFAIASGPRDITAAAFGDPLPGRSALDRRS
jgi:hypothetical protein